MKTLKTLFVATALGFMLPVSAQLKVDANGNVIMSGNLDVKGIITSSLTNKHDINSSSQTSYNVPQNKILQINPIRKNDGLVSPTPLSFGDQYGELVNVVDHYALNVANVKSLYPTIIVKDVNGKEYINYTELIPIMIQAIKELTQRVEELSNVNVGNPNYAMSNKVMTNINGNDITSECVLYQNSPNPFKERTMIKFDIPETANNAFIYIFNMQGTLLKQLRADAKTGYVKVEAAELPAGMYIYSLIVDNKEVDSKRMILSK